MIKFEILKLHCHFLALYFDRASACFFKIIFDFYFDVVFLIVSDEVSTVAVYFLELKFIE